MFRIQDSIRFTGFATVVLAIALPAAAEDKFFQLNFNNSWHNHSNWSPLGIPTTNDYVFIDAHTAKLSNDTAGVDRLFVTNGGEIHTNGFLLLADNSGISITQINGAGSRVLVTPRTATSLAFNNDFLIVGNGGKLDMAGGRAQTDERLTIGPGATLAGDGWVNILGDLTFKLNNAGAIRAEGGTLTIQSSGGGTLDLDGTSTALGVLEAVDGSSSLVIDGVLTDAFSGTMNIGAGNAIRFDQAWGTDNAVINFNAAGGVGTLSGVQLTHRGTMNVNAGTAKLDSLVEFESTSVVNVAAGATLDFGDNVNALHGTVSLDGGTTPATAAVIDGFSQSMFATVDVDRTAQINVPTTYFDSVTVNLNDSDDVLRLGSNSFVQNGVNFSGNGRLVNLPGSTLRTEDSTSIGVLLENQGRLNIGFGDSPGELDVEGITQTSAGTLAIDLANITPGNFDVLTVQGNAALAGTLDVSLLGGFTPLPGNSFTILETAFGVIGGTFDIEAMPTFNGLTFDVIYNSKSVVLELIEATATGDFDHDGDVDGRDFLAWQRGDSPNPLSASDLSLWQANYGATPLAASATVPEPYSFLLCLLAVPLGVASRRGASSR